LDLALILFPPDAKVEAKLLLVKTVPQNGADVWSAGFPVLGTEPMWQLGKGIISNRNVKSAGFANPERPFVIQHTAQIDPGSSGGPLLIKSKSSAAGYDAIGINTWKGNLREGANYAVPAEYIEKFIRSNKTYKPLDKDIVSKRLSEFAGIVKSENTSYEDLLHFVSGRSIFNVTAQSFLQMLDKSSDDARQSAKLHLEKGEIVKAVRIIAADSIWQKRKNVLELKSFTEGPHIECIFTENGKEVKTYWQEESGSIYLAQYLPPKKQEIEFWETVKVIFIGIIKGIKGLLPISSMGDIIYADEFIRLNIFSLFKDIFPAAAKASGASVIEYDKQN
jgi:serine protease Do